MSPAFGEGIEFELIDDFRISSRRREELRLLLRACFERATFADSRTYAKQVPPWRLIAVDPLGVVGHLGLERRMIGLAGDPASVFGIIDLCVAQRARGRGLASEMLSRIERLARENRLEFMMLFARDPRLYERNGFSRAANPLRWLKIHEHESLGMAEEPLLELMVKSIGDRAWVPGLVDLLGYQF